MPVKKPLTVDIEAIYRNKKIHEWFKKNFADLPAHLKVTYSIGSTDYFLSMPDGKEDVENEMQNAEERMLVQH